MSKNVLPDYMKICHGWESLVAELYQRINVLEVELHSARNACKMMLATCGSQDEAAIIEARDAARKAVG